VLTLDGFIGHTFSSKISGSGTTYLNTIPGVFTSFSPQDLGDKAMYRLGVSADYAFTTQIHANIGVDYLAFKYGRSAIFNEYSYEPDSKTNYTNVKVGVGYAF
jgi:opacity protein-like surface antigen